MKFQVSTIIKENCFFVNIPVSSQLFRKLRGKLKLDLLNAPTRLKIKQNCALVVVRLEQDFWWKCCLQTVKKNTCFPQNLKKKKKAIELNLNNLFQRSPWSSFHRDNQIK